MPNATYHYELTFFTGQRSGAATSAQVSCLLVGEREDSGICILKDDNRPTFRQGSANAFLISVAGSLGAIKSLTIWHDNYGLSPEWFLKRVVVRDLQSEAVTIFICERWFALDEDDGAIRRKLIPADEKELTSIGRLFNSKLYKDFTDAHLWFSVILKPSRSTFSRAQRASCCLCLLCTAMVTSAMFYGQTDTEDDSGTLALGPIKINLRSIMIGIQCSLIIIPVNVAIVTIFKHLKPKVSKEAKKGTDDQASNVKNAHPDEEFYQSGEENFGFDDKELKEKNVYLDCAVCEQSNSRSTFDDVPVINKQPTSFCGGISWIFRNKRQKYVVQSDSIDSARFVSKLTS